MKKIFAMAIVFFFSLFFLNGKEISAQDIFKIETLEGKVVKEVEAGKESVNDQLVDFQLLEIELTRGEKNGQTVQVKNSAVETGYGNSQYQKYQTGDNLKIIAQEDSEGGFHYSIDGRVRRIALYQLFVIFVVVVLLVGRFWGVLSLLGLGLSFLVIFKITLPMIIKGYDPVWSAIFGSAIIIPSTFYISHGFNKKTHVGVIATLLSLVATGLLASYFTARTHLTGLATEEAGFLQVEKGGLIDIKSLLLAGIIIGVLGILDDVTIGQASVAQQIKEATSKITFWELFKKSMKVGQDHISSMVNTLVLVYSGSALPLLLLFFDSQKTIVDVIELEVIAEEIVKMLTGSIGLVIAAPLATFLAAYVFSQEKSQNARPVKLAKRNDQIGCNSAENQTSLQN
ncbi:MAG: YibE/F family protein [Patescibacteria group bacterium]